MGERAGLGASDRAREILAFVPGPVASVLDFGAGEGHLVAALRAAGLEADGVEPSPAGRQAAARLYGLDLAEDLQARGQREWGLVTLIHSLEHVGNPVRELTRLRDSVAPGGHVFIEVPHARSFEMWRPGRRRQILDLPVHLHHFTPATLQAVLEKAGFRIARIQLTNPDWLEWVLRRREQWLKRQNRSFTDSSPTRRPRPGKDRAAAPGLRDHWRSNVVPWIRDRAPGWKFQVLARPATEDRGR